MLNRPQRGDPFWIWMLHWWEVFSWAIIGLLALITVLSDLPPGPKYGSLALMAVLGACCLLVRTRKANPVRLGYAYVGVLVAVLGALAYLRPGYGVLYTVMLPHFMIYVDALIPAIVSSGLGAVAITVGGALRQGWSAGTLTTNTISSAAVWAVAVLISVATPRALALRDERARLRSQLADAQEELAEAHRRRGVAEERERMAREIHDTLAQGFASIVALTVAARTNVHDDPGRAVDQLRSIEQTARENLTEARALVGSAPRSGLAPDPISRTLHRTVRRFAEDTGLTMVAELPDLDCDQTGRIALLRCAQEALANVRKHAQATTVGVVLAQRPEAIELEITDDGRGFDVSESIGFGLDGMRRRLDELGGELTITSAAGAGTRILAAIPLRTGP
ncbi:sensor histidine kinase [Nonomuraea sp. PA05]|uniref:sensor histidine kinase n=1 Tax=Nonomuraea sp. PA05 TaxID=2604466 RepID=UPI0011D4A7E3|nr:sensor histidine kinase [Nonomuraea sp. PA05]TYB50562.1 sensor histidine kinase [Nonomuraea sp. PA05]